MIATNKNKMTNNKIKIKLKMFNKVNLKKLKVLKIIMMCHSNYRTFNIKQSRKKLKKVNNK